MKIQIILNVVLAVAVIILCVQLVRDKHASPATSDGKADAQSNVLPEAAADSETKEFSEIDFPSDFHGNPFTWFKGDGLLLAAGDKNGFNAMTIGWGALGNIWERGTSTMTVYVAKGRYTYQFMEQAKYFTVMAFDDKHKDVLHYMGSHSGRDGDKAAALGLHTLYTENGTPYFAASFFKSKNE